MACSRLIGSSSKQLRAMARSRYERDGSPRFSLPSPTLIATSQQVAMLTNLRLAGSSIEDLAVLPSRGTVLEEPDDSVGVEERVDHSMYSRNSSSGASKSGAIQ